MAGNITQFVDEFERQMNGDPIYTHCWKELSAIEDLNSITVAQVTEIIEPYLYKWGRMSRVMGTRKYWNWRQDLTEAYHMCGNLLHTYRGLDLGSVDLAEYKEGTKVCYDSFTLSVGPVSAGKVLHLTCPSYFPMWDTDISKTIREEMFPGGGKGMGLFTFDAYYQFMHANKYFLNAYREELENLAQKHGKPKLKILDAWLWQLVHGELMPNV